MKYKIFIIIFFSISLFSCDRIISFGINNRMDYDVYIEYELRDIGNIHERWSWYENIFIKSGETKLFMTGWAPNPLVYFGFVQGNTLDDIVNAVDKIFNDISVYRIENNENIKIYGKDYFINKKNIRKRNVIFRDYNIEYIIK